MTNRRLQPTRVEYSDAVLRGLGLLVQDSSDREVADALKRADLGI